MPINKSNIICTINDNDNNYIISNNNFVHNGYNYIYFPFKKKILVNFILTIKNKNNRDTFEIDSSKIKSTPYKYFGYTYNEYTSKSNKNNILKIRLGKKSHLLFICPINY